MEWKAAGEVRLSHVLRHWAGVDLHLANAAPVVSISIKSQSSDQVLCIAIKDAIQSPGLLQMGRAFDRNLGQSWRLAKLLHVFIGAIAAPYRLCINDYWDTLARGVPRNSTWTNERSCLSRLNAARRNG